LAIQKLSPNLEYVFFISFTCTVLKVASILRHMIKKPRISEWFFFVKLRTRILKNEEYRLNF
jgi:hypothetical protein